MTLRTTNQIRKHNARLLQNSVGGQKGMIDKTGRSQSQLSAIMGDNAYKGIGPNIARALEKDFNLPHGWLDTWHDTLDDPSDNNSEQKPQEQPALYAALTPETDQIDLLRSIIETIGIIEEEEGLTLTPAEKAQAIIACLKTCMKRGHKHSVNQAVISTAIHAVI